MIWTWVAKYWKPLCLLAAFVVVGAQAYDNGYDRSDAKWSVRWSERDTADATARADAEQAQRNEEKRRAEWAAGVQRDATQEINRLQTDVDSSTADARRLREQLATLQSRLGGTSSHSGATLSSASTTRAAMVLSKLLSSCVSQRQEVAAAFDRSRVAGLACERSYEGLRPLHQAAAGR